MINWLWQIKAKEIMSDPKISGSFISELLTNDREFMKKRFREIIHTVLDVLNNVYIHYPVEMSNRWWIGDSGSIEGTGLKAGLLIAILANIYLDLTICVCFTYSILFSHQL